MRRLDASGLAVVPGFINVLSHVRGSLQVGGATLVDAALLEERNGKRYNRIFRGLRILTECARRGSNP